MTAFLPEELVVELKSHVRTGDYESLLKFAGNATNIYPEDPVGWNALVTANAKLGRVKSALEVARNTCKKFPRDVNAHSNCANIYWELGQLKESKFYYEQVLDLGGGSNVIMRLAEVCRSLGELTEARKYYEIELKAHSNSIHATERIASLLLECGEYADCLFYYRKLSELSPESYEIFNNLGLVYFYLENFEKAKSAFNRSMQLNPKFASVRCNIGCLFEALGEDDNAIEYYKSSIVLDSECWNAHENLADLLFKHKRFEEALGHYQVILSDSRPEKDVLLKLANTLHKLGRFASAEKIYQEIVTASPEKKEAFNNLAVSQKYQQKFSEAETSLVRALALDPDYAEARYNLALIHWLNCDFRNAFLNYEFRWDAIKTIGDKFSTQKASWLGHHGERVFVWREQGIGDEILFSSTIPELAGISKKVIVEVDHRLIPLLQRSFPAQITYISDRTDVRESEFDRHVAMASQFFLFRRNLDAFKRTSRGFLVADQSRVERTKRLLDSNCDRDSLRVGISWCTRSVQDFSFFREIPLIELASAISISGVQLINLQYGDIKADLISVEGVLGISIADFPEIDNSRDIDGLASLMCCCDVVVSIDNLTVNLAGSLGVRTLALIPYIPDPRWGIDAVNSWVYESLDLYRQRSQGDWSEVLERIQRAIENLVPPSIDQ